jgi:hypothetical protein
MTRPTATTVKVWTKMVHSKENLKTLGKELENLDYSKRLWEINCTDKKSAGYQKLLLPKMGRF